jgi:cysteine-rich repeat protein
LFGAESVSKIKAKNIMLNYQRLKFFLAIFFLGALIIVPSFIFVTSQGKIIDQCSNLLDDDNDGLIDAVDPACHTGDLNNESMDSFGDASITDLNIKFDAALAAFFAGAYGDYNQPFSDPYYIDQHISGMISMYEATQNNEYIFYALEKIEATMTTMIDVDNDAYLEWLGDWNHDNNVSTENIAYCIASARGGRQIARLARVIKTDSILNNLYGSRADVLIDQVKHNIINHPACVRSFNSLVNTVHHKAAHQVEILLNIYLASGDHNFEVDNGQSYYSIITSYATLFKNSLFNNSADPRALVWSSTDSPYVVDASRWPECYHISSNAENPLCRDSYPDGPYVFPDDTSHAENFISTMLNLYQAGIVFDRADVDKFIYTFKNVIWNKDIENPLYADFIDGQDTSGLFYAAGIAGTNIAPGWLRLAAFDPELQMIFSNGDNFDINDNTWYQQWLQLLPFYGELAKNQLVGDCQYTNSLIEIYDNLDNDCDGHVDENISAYCGNNHVDLGEQCDDGDTTSGDGCSSSCQTEVAPGNNGGGGGGGQGGTPPPPVEVEPEVVCGNSIEEEGETCDDGNILNNDGCSYLCQIEEDVETPSANQIEIPKLQGTLIKTQLDPRVYYINNNNERYYIPNFNTFASWFQNFNSLSIVTPQTLASYPYLGRLTVKPGNLVKFDQDNKVYAVEPTKTLRWITSGNIFQDFGYDFNKIIHLPSEDFQHYTIGSDITNSNTHPTGQLLKHGNFTPIFYIKDSIEYWIKDESTFLSLGFKWQDIITIPVRYWYTRVLDGLQFRLQDR